MKRADHSLSSGRGPEAREIPSPHRGQGHMARRLVLVLVLGLLGALILILSAQAYVARKTEDSLDDFDSGTFVYTGLLDIPPDIHSVQLLPIGLTGEWTTTLPLPMPLADFASAVNGDVVYVIGGNDDEYDPRAEVHAAQMTGVQGGLTPWQPLRALPAPRAGAAAAVHSRPALASSMLYVVGGLGPGVSPTNSVYRAEIDNATGQILGNWTPEAQLPQALFYASAVVYGDFLYVIGGTNGLASFDTVYYAAINPNGSLDPFVPASPLPKPLFDGYAIVYDGAFTDTVYYVGGAYITPPYNVLSSFEVYFADLTPGGALSAWQRSDGALPIHLYAHSGVLVNQGEIIVTGGIADPLDPMNSFTSTVKAALVDPDNPSFRLYDWCRGVKPPWCTVGAWQTGGLLPDVRALHASVAGHGSIYVMGGEDANQNIVDTIFVGTVNGAGALFAPEGFYRSDEINLEQPATLKRLEWMVTIGFESGMGLTMQYRTSPDGESWSAWSDPEPSQNGPNWIEPISPPAGIQYVQYQANFTTVISTASPSLDNVHVYYEVEDPDVQVRKDTGSVISAELDTTLEYNIYYTNTGGWVAENVLLTETLPEHTTYAGAADWQQVGTSNVYTYRVGDLERGASGSTPFLVQINDQVPPGTTHITNRVEIDYPPMIDALGYEIVDPRPEDNWYEFVTPLALFSLALSKDAVPPPGSIVTPGSVITYTLRYTNTGQIGASQTVLTDTFDSTGSYTITTSPIPPTATEYIWDLGALQPRDPPGKLTITVQLLDPLPNHWPVTNRASLYSPEGPPIHSPVITHTVMNMSGTELVPMVDLIISDVQWDPTEVRSGTWPVFEATVVNDGDADADEHFWVELYIKPHPSEPPRWPADHDRGYCLDGCQTLRYHYVGYVGQLAAGESTVVRFQNLGVDPSPDFPKAGDYDIYVQADVAFTGDNLYWGAYAEDYENNNLWQGFLHVEPSGPRRIYLPIVVKGP